MWIQVFGLSCLLSLLEAQAPTYNPECGGMKTAAKHLKSGIQSYLKKSANCRPNPHCTGVMCTWSGGGLLEIDLHHCDNPVTYHVYLHAPSKNIHHNLTLRKGDDKELVKGDLGNVKLNVKELSRKGNIVTTTVQLEACSKQGLCFPPIAVLDQQKFCVKMENCPTYNASTDHYKPCGVKPTGQPGTHPLTHPYPERSTSTAFPGTGSIDAHKGGRHKDSDSSKLSTAAIIGIAAAAVFAILIVIAVVVYWKKYHHRSRLRAAYYNDISMHDPLYEDFGPEVA
ncbi:uncharacterized protein LOC144644394 isoform X2 [Oculina patagonica]